MDDEDLAEFLTIFREESLERLARVSRALEALRDDPGVDRPALLEEIDRELHTVKGSARLLGFTALGALVHDLEGLARLHRQHPQVGRELLAEAMDRLATLVETASAEQEPQDAALHERVRAALLANPGGASPGGANSGGANSEGGAGKAGQAAPQPAPAPPPLVEAAPPSPRSAPAPAEPAPREADRLGSDERPGLPDGPGGEGGRSARGRRGGEDELVRVRATRLAVLDELVSDLTLTHLRLQSCEDQLRRLLVDLDQGHLPTPAAAHALRQTLHEFRDDTRDVRRAAQRLQRLAVDVRLRPVEHLLDVVPREARELARRLDKQVRVRLSGEDTELDRVLLEHLRSPLTHLITNALDHGLETPAERLAAGKPPEGLLEVSAGQEGGQVVIRVRDDGRGMDAARIRQLAVQRGLLPEPEARDLSDEQALELVFVPGFSTRSSASALSGRGVGMDVVRSTVEALGGEVTLHSQPGQGTTTTLRLPLTQLVTRAAFVRAGGQQFAVPTESLQESLRIPVERVTSFAGRQVILLGERSVPVVNLARFLGQRELPEADTLGVLLLRHADDLLALTVEDLLEERAVVVKPLGWPLELVPGFAGVVHLPTGEVALLLHVPELFALARAGGGEPPPAARRPAARRTILVVDDSIVSRQLVGRHVEALGFDLYSAVDGLDALSLLERVVPDLILTDLEMPRLNGLGLVRRVKSDERLSSVPVVIVSTRGAESDRQAGLLAGADAYLTKAELSEKELRRVIERLL